MPITDNKIVSFLFNHKDQIDELYQTMTSDQVKANFDSRAEELKDKVNALIDDLMATTNGDSGAHNIGVQPIEGLTGNNLYEVLQSIKNSISSVALGTIPDNSITNSKLVTDIRIGSLATLNTTNKSNITNAINEILVLAGNLQNDINNKLSEADIGVTPIANKLLRLNAYAKYDTSITGDSNTVDGKHALTPLSTNEKTDLAGAINEVNSSVTGLGNTKVNKSDTATYMTPGKLLYANANGIMPTDITGNAEFLNWKRASDFAPSGYGLGNVGKDISGLDLNNVTASGFYFSTGNSINQPVGNTCNYLVFSQTANKVTQICVSTGTNAIYLRSKDTSWSSWEQIIGNNKFSANSYKYRWTGTLVNNVLTTITHNLNKTDPIVMFSGTTGNVNMNWIANTANTIQVMNYNGGNNDWSGVINIY